MMSKLKNQRGEGGADLMEVTAAWQSSGIAVPNSPAPSLFHSFFINSHTEIPECLFLGGDFVWALKDDSV